MLLVRMVIEVLNKCHAEAALLKHHLVETFRIFQGSVASLKSIYLEYVGNNICVTVSRQ